MRLLISPKWIEQRCSLVGRGNPTSAGGAFAALSQLSVWAGRSPVARTRREYISGVSNPHELLDYGSAHPIMKMFFERARKELESKLRQPIGSRFESLVVTRQPGHGSYRMDRSEQEADAGLRSRQSYGSCGH